MSAKWIRAKKWDDQHLNGWLWPVKVLLRVFSSIPLAVVLLSLVALYGILASVPIGLIALAPTYVLYGLTLVAAIALLAVAPAWGLARGLRSTSMGRGGRFAVILIATIVLVASAAGLWVMFAWPRIRYDGVTQTGFRMFGSFVDAYKSVQFRRLPMMEMSELEFYSWWPLRVVLILFVVNMVVATVRRIEFSFPYIGVLTVHTGIVVIALGSVYYSALKQEGDMLLLAGQPDAEGKPASGPPESGFYDNTEPALWVSQRPELGWEQRRLGRAGAIASGGGIPRYNDYNLNALQISGLPPMARGDTPDFGPLDVRVPPGPAAAGSGKAAVDPDVHFRVVGYASHADLTTQWMGASQVGNLPAGRNGSPMRMVEAYLTLPPDPNDPGAAAQSERPQRTWQLLPDLPAKRVDVLEVEGRPLLGLEYTRERADQTDTGGGMSEERWRDLSVSLPRGVNHALIIRHKASGFEQTFPVVVGQRITVGNTGYTVEVVSLSPEPPFPIITRGYQGARSSVAVVRVQPPPAKEGSEAEPAYERWIYHRFAEINQDLVDRKPAADGAEQSTMPMRRAADDSLQISYIDASILQIYLDERADGTVRGLVRLPGGIATVTPALKDGESLQVATGLKLKLAGRMDDAVQVEYPFNTLSARRDTRAIGNHQKASIAVEVSLDPKSGDTAPWRSIVWVPFSQYARAQSEGQRSVTLPDGRRVSIMFGRVRHEFWPPMAIALADFEMIPYPHSQTPRDYKSDLIVMRRWSDKHEDVQRKTSLNEPLLERTPFQRRDDLPGIANALGWVLSLAAPNQYKFSQAGWDQAGWNESLALVESGQLKRPMARYTILGVGNNPGIYIIAAGAVMMSVGIPWAFYVKPWLMRRRKKRIQEQIARGEIAAKPARAPLNRTVSEPAAAAAGVEELA